LVLTLILAESSVELVPNEIVRHPSILASARKKKREPSGLILDQSYHHVATLRLTDSGVGRGRPDIVHFSLLTALGSPLNSQNKLECIVHTRDDHVITVNSRARLPRNTDRFTSLLEQLYEESVIPSADRPLLTIQRESLRTLIHRRGHDKIIALSTLGTDKPLDSVADELHRSNRPAVLIGGFPEGHFSQQVIKLSSQIYRIDKRHLEAWTVVGRTIYDYEKNIGLDRF